MIITITGKPCSGKGTVGKLFAEKYNFEYLCTGDIFRHFTKEFGYDNILDFQTNNDKIKEIDFLVDNKTTEIGKTRLEDNIIFDSRLAWYFIPDSFKVFIDIDWQTAGERLLSANRSNEKVETTEQAIKILKDRWKAENDRYIELYNTSNLDLNNYDYIISSKDKTPEEIVEELHNKYIEFVSNKNN